MKGERGNFKGRVFGGFNRHDVIDYIETLAKERNDLALENQKLLGRVEALEERLDELMERLPKNCEEPEYPAESGNFAPQEFPSHEELVQRRVEQVLTHAHDILGDVKRSYEELCRDVNINISQADHELKAVSGKLTALQESLRTAGERLGDMDLELDIMPLSGPEVSDAKIL